MTSYVAAWAQAFALTVATELVVAGALLARREPTRGAQVRVLALVVFAQLLTHPAVWFVLPELHLGRARVAVSEAWAFAVEALFYWVALRVSPARAAAVSLAANAASFAVGVAVGAFPL